CCGLLIPNMHRRRFLAYLRRPANDLAFFSTDGDKYRIDDGAGVVGDADVNRPAGVAARMGPDDFAVLGHGSTESGQHWHMFHHWFVNGCIAWVDAGHPRGRHVVCWLYSCPSLLSYPLFLVVAASVVCWSDGDD